MDEFNGASPPTLLLWGDSALVARSAHQRP
jgi:hypothetical protein